MRDLLYRVRANTEDYINNKGGISCEESISSRQKDNILLLKTLSEMNRNLKGADIFCAEGKVPGWKVEYCKTCKEYTKGKYPFHLELTWIDSP